METTFSWPPRRQIPGIIVVFMGLGVMLAAGFLPTALHFATIALHYGGHYFGWGSDHKVAVESLSFVGLSFLFYLSVPERRGVEALRPSKDFLFSIFGPALVAGIYGRIVNPTPLEGRALGESLIWFGVCAPIGEELLFRGWVFRLVDRLRPNQYFSITYPLPACVWLSAIAFCFWHVQNFFFWPASLVFLQLGYTLFVGLWLGYVRWQTRSLMLPITAHVVMNLLSLPF